MTPVRVEGATNDRAARQIALVYDARMALFRCVLAMAVMTGVACGGAQRKPPPDGTSVIFTKTYAGSVNRNVDVLFLIDDSSSMKLTQDKFLRDFPTFMTGLQGTQGLPNLHLAVISQDMGAGDGSITGCDTTGGKQGIFQYAARGTCTATNLDPGATYIADIAGVRNYTGNAADVFKCIAALGEAGCGFESQFASLLRALGADGRAAPAENQGFLRPDAYLAIIMLTNEDDCSATPGVPLFDTGSNSTIQSQLGPPGNFRCNEFGHDCDGAHPARFAPNNDVTTTVTYNSCSSNDSEGYLLGATDTANRIKALKNDPSQIAVVAIQAPATPYTVNWKNPSPLDTSCGAASCPWPVIAHSCAASDGSFGDPGVRTAQLVREFGAHGVVLPICVDSFASSLDRAAMLINSLLSPPCIPGRVQQNATETPDCKVTRHVATGTGSFTDKVVPSCADNGGVAPCWQLTVGGAGCETGQILDVSADPNVSPTTATNITVSCALCQAGVSDFEKGCP